VQLVTTGFDQKIRGWSSSTKGTEYNLDPAAWVFNLANPTQRQLFISFGNSGIWIEGYNASNAERDISFTLIYSN
jgi:hypothetical protein